MSRSNRTFPPACRDGRFAWAESEPGFAEGTAARSLHDTVRATPPERRLWRETAREALALAFQSSRHGVEAEQAGRFREADFYWREVRGAVRRWAAQRDAGRLVFPSLPEGGASRAHESVAQEIFGELHLAFFNGHRAASRDERAFVHIEFAVALLEDAKLSAARRFELLRDAAISWFAVNKRSEEARRSVPPPLWVVRLLAQTPRAELIDDWASLAVLRALHALDKPEGDAGRTLATLTGEIARLRSARKAHPEQLGLYGPLGFLYELAARVQAGSGDLAEALVDVERSIAFVGLSERLGALRNELSAQMVALQRHMADVQAQLAQRPGAHLNDAGRRWQAQARVGFVAAKAYFASPEPAEVAAARDRALAASREAEAPSAESELDEPLLNAPVARASRDRVPLRPWLVSRQGKRIKAQLLLAAALLSWALGQRVHETMLQNGRDESYELARAALDRGEFAVAMDQAARFLGTDVRRRSAPREASVWRLYDEAVVGWFSAHAQSLVAEGGERLATYRRLGASRPGSREEQAR